MDEINLHLEAGCRISNLPFICRCLEGLPANSHDVPLLSPRKMRFEAGA